MDRSGHSYVFVLLDLSSAFDTINHAILLEVLEKRFGFTGIALKWYCSYVDERTQTFLIGSLRLFAIFGIHCSVPQGAVREALKFVTYTESTGCKTAICDQPPCIS